jgi:transcription elongation factor Elf1
VPIRIDLSKIDPANLTADEDHASGLSFMEEGPSFMEEGLEDPSNSDSLGQWAEDNAAYVDDPERAWSSLTGLNSLAHRGMIPAEALSRDPEWDYDQRYEKWTHVSAFNRDKWKNSGVDDTLDDEQSGGECYYAAMSLADQYPELEYRAGYYYAPDRRYPEGREEPHAWVVDKEGRIYDNTHSQFDPNFPVVRGEDPSSELGRRYKSWTDHSGLPDGWLEDIPDPYDPMKALGPDYQHSDICANCGEKERSLGLLWCDDCIESLKESSVPEGHYPCPACNKSEIEVLSLDGMKTQFVCPTCGWKGGPEVLEPIRAYAAFDRLRWEQRSGQPSNNVPLVNDGRKIDPQGAGICPNCRGNALVMPKQNLVWCPECKRSIKDGIVGFDLDEYQAEYAQGKIDWALKPKASGVYRSDLEGFVDVDWKIRMGAFDKTEWERRQPPPGDPNEIQLWDKDGSSITRCPGCGSQALLERTSPDSEGTIACGECEGWYHADGSFADGLPKHIVDDIMRPLQKRQAMSLPQGDWQQSDYDLLHWTKPENVASMLTGGIVPWDEHPEDLGKSRYESDEFQTRPGYVYMGTQGYQPINPEEKLVPVRVDHRQLDPEDFEADEDWMKMMYENTDPEYEPDDPVWEYQPTAPSSHGNLGDWANANAEMMNDPEYTFHSYSAGSVAHRGMIPPSALSLVDGHEYPPEAYEVNPVHPDQQELFDRKVAAFDRGKWEQRQDLGSGGGSKQMNLTYIGVCPNGHDAVRQQNLASCPECGTFFDMEKGSSLKMLRSEVRSAQRRMEELRRSSAFNPDWWRKRQDHVEPPQENSLQWELGRNPGEIPEYKGLEAEYFCQNCGGDSVIGYWDDDGELKCGDCDHEWLRDQDVTLWKKRGAFDRSDWERPEQGMRLWGEERPECPLCHGFNTYQAESHSRLACFDCQMEIETAYPDLGIKTWAMTDWVEDSDNQVGRDFWEQRRQEQEFNDEQDLLGRPKLPREGGFDRKRWEERKPTPDPLDDPKQIFDPNAAFGPTHSLDKILLCPNCGSDKEVLVQAPGLGTKADDLVCGLCRYEWSKAEEGLKNYWRPADWS